MRGSLLIIASGLELLGVFLLANALLNPLRPREKMTTVLRAIFGYGDIETSAKIAEMFGKEDKK
jgi:hypothetical protein